MPLDDVDQILLDAHDALPTETAKKVAIPSRNVPKKQVQRYKVGSYPMARGIRQAKIEIVKILTDSDNLASLREKLQDYFDADPITFFKTFEPMLRVYEQIERNKKDEKEPKRGAIKIIVEEGAALKVEDNRKVVLDGQASRADNGVEEADNASGNEGS